MKKSIVLILTSLICLAVFAGCGSESKEEKRARKEIEELQKHLEDEAAEDGVDLKNLFQQEAAADGVDLKKMLEQEAAESLARTQARTEKREQAQAIREDLDAYYDPLLQAEYDALITADTAADTRMHAETYNELLDERNTLGNEVEVSWGINSYVRLNNVYRSKALFLAALPFSDYDEYHLYYTGDFVDASWEQKMMLFYAKNNTCNNWGELEFIKEDDSFCRLDMGAYFAEETFTQLTMVSDSFVEVCAIENSDWNYYLFDITGTDAVLIDKSTDYEDFAEYVSHRDPLFPYEELLDETHAYVPAWDDSFEELNDMIVRNTIGAAADPYKYG